MKLTRLQFSAATLAALTTLSLFGCGGGGTSSPTVASYAGRRVSALTLATGKAGALDMTVAADGVTTGTLTVTDSRALTRGTFTWTAGTYTLTGTTDASGHFTMTGNLPGFGPFTLTGTVGANGSGGSWTLTAGDQTVTGSFGGATPTPTPAPTPTPVPVNNTTFKLIAGNGSASNLTTRYWRAVSLKANPAFWNSTGADQPCPVRISSKLFPSSDNDLVCSSEDIAYRSDGRANSYDGALANIWEIGRGDVSTFTIDGNVIIMQNGWKHTIKPETVNGKPGFRRFVTSVVNKPEFDYSDYVGIEIVYEEVFP